ncbi:hypothetical protein [Streptomyces sp. bgisy060]|uniref:hypothetical protein n=1 Tax=Streptomyces sp. bgisy060 TaxID=3413775 RepID=UPI003EB8F844
MIRYGIAIKALPKGKGNPFEDEEDQDDESTDGSERPEDDTALDDDPPDEEPPAPVDAQEPPGDEDPKAEPAPDHRDARPWSGDPYDEGDESDPEDAFAAYKGAGGEEAWLDRAPDGTLTGWLRDETGQVWRYTDPNTWAIDVDDAQMTRTHSQASDAPEQPTDDHGGQDPLFPPTR